jgi:Zn-dependent peptidase ImmA (M78 family)
MTRGRRRFTAAHELAHALLHSGTDAIIVSDTGRRGDQRERFADAFAGEFLMPEEGIRRALEALGYGPKIDDAEPVIHLQRMFNVSYITALVRLRQANIITTSSLEKLRKISPMMTAEQMGYQAEPGEGPLEPDRSIPSRYPLKFRTLLRRCIAEEVVGSSSTATARQLSSTIRSGTSSRRSGHLPSRNPHP